MLPDLKKRKDGRGRPGIESRSILEGVLWVLRSGARWKDLPPQLPSYQTCHRRFQQWVKSGVMEKILEVVTEDLRDWGKLDLTEAYIDGSFAPAKKEVQKSVKPRRARARKSWQSQTALVFLSPLGLKVLARMKYDLLKRYSGQDLSEKKIARVIGDKAYDSDPLDQRFRTQFGTELIALRKGNRKRERSQDGRPLRRCRRRW